MNGSVGWSWTWRLAHEALAVLVGAILLAGGATTVAAQVPASDSVPRFDLDSLVVDVLGTPVRLGQSPYPVSVIGEAELRRGKTGMFLEDALEDLPGVQVQNRFNYAVGERISIRGFGARAQFGVSGIHVEVDGIPATLADGQSTIDHLDIGSLGRVEALRGPASALYGNAAGGVLRFETELPSQAGVREEATAVVGSDGLLRLQSTTSGTLGTAAYLVSLNRLKYDGFREDTLGASYGGAERIHLNGRLEQPMAGGELGIVFNHVDLDAENPGSLPPTTLDADPKLIHPFYTPRFMTGKEVQQSQLGVSWSGPVGDLDAEAAVYGLTRDFFNPIPFDIADVDRRAGGGRLMLGYATASGDVDIEVRGGADVDFQNDDRREFGNTGGRPDDLLLHQTEKVRGLGVFLQTSVSVSQRVSLLGGIRYDRTRFEVDDLFPIDPSSTPPNLDDSGKRTMDAFSPTVGIQVSALPELGLFANFATSFQTPSAQQLGNQENVSGGFNPDLDPQNGKTFEVGARGVARDRISYEFAYFHTTLEDELIPFENVDAIRYWRNAANTTRDGVEGVVRARFHELASGQVSYTWIKARFDEYMIPAMGTDPAQDFSDNKVPGLAPQQLRGSIRLGPAAWYVTAGIEYRDEVPVNDANDGRFADSYTLFDIRVGGSGLTFGGVELSPFAGVQNLTDETYVSSVAVNAFGSRFYEPGPGRTFYVGGTLAASR